MNFFAVRKSTVFNPSKYLIIDHARFNKFKGVTLNRVSMPL